MVAPDRISGVNVRGVCKFAATWSVSAVRQVNGREKWWRISGDTTARLKMDSFKSSKVAQHYVWRRIRMAHNYLLEAAAHYKPTALNDNANIRQLEQGLFLLLLSSSSSSFDWLGPQID